MNIQQVRFWKIFNLSVYNSLSKLIAFQSLIPSLTFFKFYITCDLHKTVMSKSIHYQFKVCYISCRTFLEFPSLIPVFASFTLIFTISLFKISCWQCWKTAGVHQMKMLDEGGKDSKLAPLKPVVEREQDQGLLLCS